MNERSFSLGNWFGRTIQVMSKALDLRSQKHAVIAGNVANMDTPGYKPRELTFEKELQQAIGTAGLQPRRTHGRHLPVGPDQVAELEPRLRMRRDYAMGNGSYQLDLDKEMAKLAQNNLIYEATVQLIAKKMASLRFAITEGGK